MKRKYLSSLVTVFSVVAVLGVLLVSLGALKSKKEIRIGVIVPLTGGAAEFGKWARNAVEVAITDLNEKEISSDNRYIAVHEDNKMDPKSGLSAFKKLVEVDRVIGVITSGSGIVLAIAPEAERTHTVQINHSAVSPDIRKAGHTPLRSSTTPTLRLTRLPDSLLKSSESKRWRSFMRIRHTV